MNGRNSRPPARPAGPEAGPAEAALRTLLGVMGALRQATEPYFSRFGISGPQWAILRVLQRAAEADEAPLAHKEIGRRLLLQPPSVTAIVDRLERQGWVRRGSPPKDLRVRPVSLTAAGLQLVRRVEHGHRAHVGRVFAGLDADELVRLRGLLEKLQSHLSAHGKPDRKPARPRRV